MVDGVILLVDVASGPRAQTRFVLSKALMDPSVTPIVVINKVDRQHGRAEGEVENDIFELFVGLDASDAQMDYPVLYASAKQGWVESTWDDAQKQNHSKGESRSHKITCSAQLKSYAVLAVQSLSDQG